MISEAWRMHEKNESKIFPLSPPSPFPLNLFYKEKFLIATIRRLRLTLGGVVMKRIFSFYSLVVLFSVVLFACEASNIEKAQATSIQQVNLEQAINGAELIFEGKAMHKEIRISPDNGKPFTYFTFQILDVIKGAYPSNTIELGFMGGPKGKFTLKVSDMRMPELGERGIYFVEQVHVQQVHPLYGWSQGHYVVIPSQQKNQDIVLPVEAADSLREKQSQSQSLSSRDLSLKNAPTLNQFKQQVVDTLVKNIQ